jgi:hypothetical protein
MPVCSTKPMLFGWDDVKTDPTVGFATASLFLNGNA